MNYLNIFVSNVRRLLGKTNKTRRQLSADTGLSESWLNDILNKRANPTLQVMGKISDALNVPLPLLLIRDPEDTSDIEPGHKEPDLVWVLEELPVAQAMRVKKWGEEQQKKNPKK